MTSFQLNTTESFRSDRSIPNSNCSISWNFIHFELFDFAVQWKFRSTEAQVPVALLTKHSVCHSILVWNEDWKRLKMLCIWKNPEPFFQRWNHRNKIIIILNWQRHSKSSLNIKRCTWCHRFHFVEHSLFFSLFNEFSMFFWYFCRDILQFLFWMLNVKPLDMIFWMVNSNSIEEYSSMQYCESN